jgi:hypothetical protein
VSPNVGAIPGSRLPVEDFRSRRAKQQTLWVCESTCQSGSPPILCVYLRFISSRSISGLRLDFVHHAASSNGRAIRGADGRSSETILHAGSTDLVCIQKERTTKMKLTNVLAQTNRSFASVFLAFSLFGFLFPHKADQVKQNHQVNLTTTEQTAQPEPADDGSQYEWFY